MVACRTFGVRSIRATQPLGIAAHIVPDSEQWVSTATEHLLPKMSCNSGSGTGWEGEAMIPKCTYRL